MDALLHDLSHAVQRLRQSPGFAFVAVLSLTLGISANVTMFGGFDVFQLRALPFDKHERLVQVWTTNVEQRRREVPFSIPDYLDWREKSRSVELGAYRDGSLNISDGLEPERLAARRVSANLFSVMGTQPAIGRGFLPEEEAPDRGRVAVLSNGLWARKFGSNPLIIGR